MNIIRKFLLAALGTSILTAVSTVYATNPTTKVAYHQNTQKAVEYFDNELNFTTNPFGAKSAIDQKEERIVIIDVRAAKDYKEGHIPGAINLPFHDYNSFNGGDLKFPELKKDNMHYIYCYELLCSLAQKAAKQLASLGYQVKEIKGGFNSWKEHDYPVEK